MKFYSVGLTKADSAKRYAEIKREFPPYARRSHSLVRHCLEKHNPHMLEVFLGNKDETLPNVGISADRIFAYNVVRYLCMQMEKVDKEDLHHLWTESAFQWYTRKLLKIPFAVVDSGDSYKSSIGNHSQELMKSIRLRIW